MQEQEEKTTRVPPERNRGGRWVDMGGEAYLVPPLSFGAIKVWQDEMAALRHMSGLPTPDQIDTVVGLFHAALSRNYPSVTKEEVENLVDLGNYGDLLEAVMSISGFKKVQPGEAVAQQQSDQTAGTTSTAP